MQYVADPGDFRNLAKNIQISNLQSPLFIAWLHAKEQYFLHFVYFLQKLRFRHFHFLFRLGQGGGSPWSREIIIIWTELGS